jgi:uncharacterized membrane protein YqaE (UPF0057 family)
MSQAEFAHQEVKLRSKGISLDILWVLVILSGFLFFTSLIPLPPNDFWWHLKIGEYIYINHTIPTTNIFAWTLPADQPFYYAAWLAEWLFYALFRLGGLALLTFFRTVLIGAAVWLIAEEAHRRSKSWRITALVIAILSVMITNNLPVRTQMWAWLPFVTTYIILKRYTERIISWRWLTLCPIGMLIWVNVHGSYILGLVLIGAFFAGEVVSKFLLHEETKTWQHIGWIGGAGIASSLAVLINPRFTGIVNYTIDLLTDPPSQRLIEEWQSPSPHGLANITFFVSILLFILLTIYSKYRLTPTEAILYGGFLWLAWSGQRYVIWYGMVATPILARLITSLPLKMPSFTPQKNWLNLILAILLFVPAIAVQPWFVERQPLPDTYWQQVIRGSESGALLSDRTPVSASEYLNAHPGGKLFNEMGYGSYLIWEVPGQKVFVDPRVELYPYAQWLDYIRINNGADYNDILMQYGSDRILLDKNLQSELMRLLQDDPLWVLEYDDEYAQIYRKNSSP